MNNLISKIIGMWTLVTAALLIAFMASVPFMQMNIDGATLGTAFILLLFAQYGNILIYVSEVPFVIVAVIFGIKMIIKTDPDRLFSLHKRMLITAFVLAPFVALGLAYVIILFTSTENRAPSLFPIAVAAVYGICLIAQIVGMIIQKKSA